jgi:hypothetical protein
MAVGIKRLCGVALPATTLTNVYTATQEVALSTIVVCNRGTTATTFRLAHAPGGAADALGDYFAYDAPIEPKQMVPFTIGVCLAATDVLRAYAGNANLTVVAWGEEGAASGGGASTFLDLTDTPGDYAGDATRFVRVNAAETALEFVAQDPELAALSVLTSAADTLPYYTGSGTAALAAFTAAGRTLVAGADAAAQRTALGLGTMAQQDANAVAITGGYGTFTGNVAGLERSGDSQIGFYSLLNAAGGASRFAFFGLGTAVSQFNGSVGIKQPPSAHTLELGFGKVAGAYGLSLKQMDGDTGGGHPVMFVSSGGSIIGSISTSATATAYNTSSDVRLKHSVATLVGALERVRALRPVQFKWNADDSPGQGFLAHELQRTIPEAVSGEPDAVNDDGSVKPQQVDHSKLVPWIIGALQEMAARLDALEGGIS